jgi:superfamily II DNA or RNA helicase
VRLFSTEHKPYVLRDYQAEDVDATFAAWEAGHRAVCVCHATGLGKSLYLAEVSRRLYPGRVLVTVDTTNLALDLAATIEKHHGDAPGVLTGGLKTEWHSARVVVATVQSLYAGGEETERFRLFRPEEFAGVLIDECESSLADKFGQTVLHFIEGNPDLKVAGCSATPHRSDGRSMGGLYDYAAEDEGPLKRNLKWGVLNGWLVKPRQGFIQCKAIDFGKLKLRKNVDGYDFSERDLAELLADADEVALAEMAAKMVAASRGKQACVFCPNDVSIAKRIAGYINGATGTNDAAQAIYGQQGDYARSLIQAHRKGDFLYAVSCNMLTKGYDNDSVVNGFMLRKTRSKRLYEQCLGRLTRPRVEIRNVLQSAPDAASRLEIIAASAKPMACMFDLVGVDPDAKDIGVLDILGDYLPEQFRQQVMEAMHSRLREPGEDDDCEGEDVGKAARDMIAEINQRRENDAREKARRAAIAMDVGEVEVTYTDNIGVSGTLGGHTFDRKGRMRGPNGVTEGQAKLLVAFGVPPATAWGYKLRQASAIIESYKARGVEPNWYRLRGDKWKEAVGA